MTETINKIITLLHLRNVHAIDIEHAIEIVAAFAITFAAMFVALLFLIIVRGIVYNLLAYLTRTIDFPATNQTTPMNDEYENLVKEVNDKYEEDIARYNQQIENGEQPTGPFAENEAKQEREAQRENEEYRYWARQPVLARFLHNNGQGIMTLLAAIAIILFLAHIL